MCAVVSSWENMRATTKWLLHHINSRVGHSYTFNCLFDSIDHLMNIFLVWNLRYILSSSCAHTLRYAYNYCPDKSRMKQSIHATMVIQ